MMLVGEVWMLFLFLVFFWTNPVRADLGENQGFILKDGIQLLGEGAQRPMRETYALTKVWVLDFRGWTTAHRPPWWEEREFLQADSRVMVLWDGSCGKSCEVLLEGLHPLSHWVFFYLIGTEAPPVADKMLRQSLPRDSDGFAAAGGWFRAEEVRKRH